MIHQSGSLNSVPGGVGRSWVRRIGIFCSFSQVSNAVQSVLSISVPIRDPFYCLTDQVGVPKRYSFHIYFADAYSGFVREAQYRAIVFNNCFVFGASVPDHESHFARNMYSSSRVHSPDNEASANGFEDEVSDLVVGGLG